MDRTPMMHARDHMRRAAQLLLLYSRLIVLLDDEFITAEAAPLASPRACEPGPGTLTLVQTDGEMSIGAGALVFPAQATPVLGDQGFYGTGVTRAAGVGLLNRVNYSTVATDYPFAWATAATLAFG